jgi:hypothetical protein
LARDGRALVGEFGQSFFHDAVVIEATAADCVVESTALILIQAEIVADALEILVVGALGVAAAILAVFAGLAAHRAVAIAALAVVDLVGRGVAVVLLLGKIGRVVGAGGRRLSDAWADGAEAHLGMVVPGFPNLFLLYGPNTNLGHNSILFMVERQVDYVLQCIAALARGRTGVVEVRAEAMDRFRHWVQQRAAATAWAGACTSWYKTASGRITNNWPGPTLAYWLATLRPRASDFVDAPSAARHTVAGEGDSSSSHR